MIEAILAGLFLGIGSGFRCTIVCLPVLSVQLLIGKKTVRDSLALAGIFSLGRLMAYLTIASAVYVTAQSLSYTLESGHAKGLTMVLLGSALLYYSFKSLKKRPRAHCGAHIQSKTPFVLILGLFSSLTACFPLVALLSLSSSSNIFAIYVSVGMFWLGSSIFMLGVASSFGGLFRLKRVASLAQRASFMGRVAAGLLALMFLANGLSFLAYA